MLRGRLHCDGGNSVRLDSRNSGETPLDHLELVMNELIEKALEDAFKEQIGTAFNVLVNGLLMEKSNFKPNPADTRTAIDRFRDGVELAKEAHRKALETLK